MPKIRCHYIDCLFLDERYCSAAAIELNPDSGCLTYTPDEESTASDWEEAEDVDEWDEMGAEEDAEDLWGTEDDDDDIDEDSSDY